MTLKARVDPDGVLRVTIPMGPEEADRAVRLTVEPASDVTTQAEWSAWVDSMAGEFSRVSGLKLDDWQGP